MKPDINLMNIRMVMPFDTPNFQRISSNIDKAMNIISTRKDIDPQYKDVYDVLDNAKRCNAYLMMITTYRSQIEIQLQFTSLGQFITFIYKNNLI